MKVLLLKRKIIIGIKPTAKPDMDAPKKDQISASVFAKKKVITQINAGTL